MSGGTISANSHLNLRTQKAVFSGTSRVLGQCFDEEATVSPDGHRVTWTAAGRRRLQVSSETPVVQVDWGLFEDGPGTPSLCILHRGSLDLHHLSGSYHSIPLPDELNRFSSLPCGIIIAGDQGCSTPPLVLVHPLEPLLNVVFKGVANAINLAAHEEIIWSSTELPIVATYNKKEEMVTLWKVSIRAAPYSVLGSETERASSDTFMLDSSPAATKTPQSQPKSLRLPNGNLSPMAFEPAPAGRHSAFPGLVSRHERCCNLQMLLQHHVPQDAAPVEGHLVEDRSGNPLLCLFSPAPGAVLAASIDGTCTRAVWAFSLDGIKSVAAVGGTRAGVAVGGEEQKQQQQQQRDLLVLKHSGRVWLYVEDRPVTPLVIEVLDHGPFLQLRPPVGGQSPGHIPRIASFQHAAGDRVTLIMHSGDVVRATITVLPVGETARAALLALERVSEQHWPMQVEDAWTGESALEWDALASTLISPDLNSSSMVDGSEADNWDDLINSEHHRKFMGSYSWAQPASNDGLEEATVQILGSPDERNLAALHEVYEDSMLNSLNRNLQPQLQCILSSLASASGAKAYSNYLKREKENLPVLSEETGGIEPLHDRLEKVLSLQSAPLELDFAIRTRAAVVWACYLNIRGALTDALKAQEQERVNAIFAKCGKEIVDCLVSHSWTAVDIDTLPCDVAVPIRQCRHDIAMNLQQSSAIGNDLDRPCDEAASKLQEADSPYNRHLLRIRRTSAAIAPSFTTSWGADGMEGINTPLTTVRFGGDSRLIDVRHLLASNAPVVLRTSEHMDDTGESAQWQQAKLQTLATRTMALAFGRGAFALRTHRALPTEPLCIPVLNLSAQIAERNNAVINLDMTAAPPAPGGGALADLTAWPEFHNGVAAGLRLAPGGDLTRTWIVYNRPVEPSYEHAGMLFGLGLTGHLGCLAMTDLYRYLSQEHDPTVIGVLLGMSAAKRCSMDPAISKMLFLHLPTRHPAGYPELEIAPLVQTAAIIGLGLLYQGSGHQSIVDILLQEIGRSPGAQHSNGASPGQHGRTLQHGITKDCESYALAAGFAVGLITLGKGQKSLAPTHSNLESQLTYYMLGGLQSGTVGRRSTLRHIYGWSNVGDPAFPSPIGLHIGDSLVQNSSSSRDSSRTSGAVAEELAAAQGAAQVILEGDLINLNVTSPAATVALGLMYLQTNDERVADLFHVPESNFELEFINPEHLCGRVMMRALVMWDSIQPTEAWVEQQLPSILQTSISQILQRRTAKIDMQTVAQAHCYCIAGACLALGIRSAGTQDSAAAAVIRKYVEYFLRNKKDVPEPGNATPSLLNRAVLESCLASAASALAIVMAGSGDLETFKLLRALRKRLATPLATNAPTPGIGTPTTSLVYGSHMAISMSLGFLFMGAGVFTFGRSPSAVASLVISLYPRLPTATNDNRYYLQALRHLYVLAAERRNVDVLDVESNEPASSVAVEISFSSDILSPRNLVAPCLLPEPHLISSLQVEAKQYWTQTFASDATKITDVISSNRAMYIQRKLSSCPDVNRSLGMGSFADAGAAGVLGAGILCNPSIRGLAQTVCLPLSDVASEDFPSTVATLPMSFSAFCRGALHECCMHDPEMLPTYLYLYSISRQHDVHGSLDGSLSASKFKLLSQFYALYPWDKKTKISEECEGGAEQGILEPVLNPTAVERWWLSARKWLPTGL